MKIHLELHLMSSLCLLSVDDVYEQDGLAAECLMVHKIKPRLSAAQRLPSGSHVVEACWEYKFRAHGQVNAPPPSPRAPAPSRGPPGPPRPPGGASAARASSLPPRLRAAWPRGHPGRRAPTPRPRAPRLDSAPPGPGPPPGSSPHPQPFPESAPPPCCFPSRCVSAPASLSPTRLPLPRSYFLGLLSFCLSLCVSVSLESSPVSVAVPCFAVALRVSLPNSLALPGCVRRSVRDRLARSPWLPLSPLSPLPSPGAGGHRTAARHQQSMTKTLSFCC